MIEYNRVVIRETSILHDIETQALLAENELIVIRQHLCNTQ